MAKFYTFEDKHGNIYTVKDICYVAALTQMKTYRYRDYKLIGIGFIMPTKKEIRGNIFINNNKIE